MPNSEAAIGRLNKSLESLGRSAVSLSEPGRRGLINEIAFGLFANIGKPASPSSIRSDVNSFALATEKALHQQRRFATRGTEDLSYPNLYEKLEIYSIAETLELYRKTISNKAVPLPYPQFSGCGTLDACCGDLIVDDILVEVKSGNRNFRSMDIRQVLIYCALNSVQRKYDIRSVSCVNPRRGVYFLVDLDTLCLQFASLSASEVLAELVYIISSGDISR